VTIVDMLTPDELLQGPVVAPLIIGSRLPPVAAPITAPAVSQPLRRFYIAVPVSPAGRFGPQPTATAIPLVEPPPPPESLTVAAVATNVIVSWEPAGGLVGFLFERRLLPEPDPAEDVFATPPAQAAGPAAPAGPSRYNVYRQESPVPGMLQPAAAPELAWRRTPGTPVNAAPVDGTIFADAIEFGRERCYFVRAVRGTPPNAIESAATPPVCLTPVDTYPPAQPVELIAVAAEGSISLIWEPGSDPDLAGYLVLRGAPGDATLRPLTPMPVTEARFVDTMVTAGTRYVYAIVAVDNAMPQPNASIESVRVEETAR
jgi:hypothetical protein